MASFDKRPNGMWRVRLCVRGRKDSATFGSKREAAAWATMREGELGGRRLPSKTLGDALTRYADEAAPAHKGERWERVRLAKLGRDTLAQRLLTDIKPADIADWRDRSLRTLQPASVAREMNLLRSVFGLAIREWGWLETNPMATVKRPGGHAQRERRVSDDEIAKLRAALNWPDDIAPTTTAQRIAAAMVWSLETGMRAGETFSLAWAQVDVEGRCARLDKTKNGDSRDVPLSTRAVVILQLLPRDALLVFNVHGGTRDVLFRRARDAAGIVDLHWHDLRHEATTRLARRLDVLDLSRMIGHRDLKSLRRYYNPTAAEIASRLG